MSKRIFERILKTTKAVYKSVLSFALHTSHSLATVIVIIIAGIVTLNAGGNAEAASYVVNSTADTLTEGTLRYAITNASATDTISFDTGVFPPGSPATITVTSTALPSITQGSITIDASNAGVIINGTGLGAGIDGLTLASTGNIIKGLRIKSFPDDGIVISSGDNTIGGTGANEGNMIYSNGDSGINFSAASGTTTILGNYIGTNSSYTALGNGNYGIYVEGQGAITIGGTTAASTNIIGFHNGSSDKGIYIVDGSPSIQGNYIGTNSSGADLANYYDIYSLSTADNITIGGAGAGEGNTIKGGTFCAVYLQNSSGTTNVKGNYIGTDSSWRALGGSSYDGIYINGAGTFNIGGAEAGAGNWICCFSEYGIYIVDGSPTIQGNYIGTNSLGATNLANNTGIYSSSTADNITIGGAEAGAGNTIRADASVWGLTAVYLQNSSGTTNVKGNYIGTDSSWRDLGGYSYGIGIYGTGTFNIGGAEAGAGNWICFFDVSNRAGIYVSNGSPTIQGNYIGTNSSGADLGNSRGISLGSGADVVTIGGTASGAGNVIGMNDSDGIYSASTNTSIVIQGNYIGTNSGDSSLPNGGDGIETIAGTITIGNASETVSNVIGPNTGYGINMSSGTPTVNFAATVNINDDVNFAAGTVGLGSSAINISGNWTNAATVTDGTSTVTFNATSGTILITPGGTDENHDFYNIIFNDAAGSATYQLQGALDVNNDLTVTDGILDTKGGSNYAITVARDFLQNGGQCTAQSSTITVGRHFTANPTENEAQYNNASIVLTGTGNLTYDCVTSYANGFNNLTCGQSGNTTTLIADFSVINTLTIGSGTLTGSSPWRVWLLGANPLSFDSNSTLSIPDLYFYGNSVSQGIPTLNNGYSCNILIVGNNQTVTQTGDITVNSTKRLDINGGGYVARAHTWITDGYNLTVGGYIRVGAGNDTATKTLNASSGTGGTTTITVGVNWTVYDTGSAPAVFTAGNSTVMLNGTADQTVATGGDAFYNLTLNNTGSGGSDDIIISGNLDVNGLLRITDGDLDVSTNDPNVNIAGGMTVDADGSIDLSAYSGTWTYDGSGTLTDSRVAKGDLGTFTIDGTSATLTLGSNIKATNITIAADDTLNLGAGSYTLELTGTGTPLTATGAFDKGTGSTVNYTGSGTTTNVTTVAYNNLTFTPASATTYNLTGNLTSGNALSGNLTINSNATVDVRPVSTDYSVSCVDVTVNGALDAASSSATITASGNWDSSLGTFTYGTSTVDLTGTGNLKTPGVSGAQYFYNLSCAAATKTTTLQSHIGMANVLTFGTGTIDGGSSYSIFLLNSSGTPFVNAGAAITLKNFQYRPSAGGTITVTAGNYGVLENLGILPLSSNCTVNFAGDITINGAFWLSGTAGSTGTVCNTQNYNLTATRLYIGDTTSTGSTTLNCGSSTIDIGTSNFVVATDGGSHALNLQTATVTCSGQWRLVNGTGTITVNPGTSTVTLDGTSDQTITTNSQPFYNLTLNNTGSSGSDDIIISGALDVNGLLTITDGDLDLAVNNPDINVAGDMSIGTSGSIASGTGTWTLDGTNQAITGSFTFYNLTKTVTSAATLTFDNTATQTVTHNLALNGASGQLLSLRSNSTGNQWSLNVQAGATYDLDYLDVKDSDASGGIQLTAINSVNSLNNLNWNFGAAEDSFFLFFE